jgi:DNA-binding response OmpR family regulator
MLWPMSLPASPDAPVPTPAPSVLVVEDDEKLARLLQRALARRGLVSVVAATGDEALRALRTSDDLAAMVLDVMIPHPDGIEVCRQARRDGWLEPVVVISARTDDGHARRAMDAGATVFLAKPFSLEDLGETLSRYLLAAP